MIRIGILGIGFMGMTHFEAAVRMVPDAATGRRRPAGRKLKNAAVTAICTRNPRKLEGDWRSIQGNFGPRGGLNDLSSFKRYDDAQELLNDPDIDLVDICLPTDQHAEMAVAALKAGKHVLVEKPIAIDLKDARRMVRTAQECQRQLFVGHVLPFFPEFAYVRESLEKRRFGALRAAHFRRVITPPDWSADMSDFRKLGGWGIDLHIHDNHFVAVTCGVPQRLFARGILVDGLVNHVHTLYVYDDIPDLAVSCVSGGIAARGLAFAHGYELYFEDATLLFSAGTLGGEWVVDRPLTAIDNKGRVRQPKLKGGREWCSAFTAELQEVVNALTEQRSSPVLSGETALSALKMCHAEAKSIATGRIVRV